MYMKYLPTYTPTHVLYTNTYTYDICTTYMVSLHIHIKTYLWKNFHDLLTIFLNITSKNIYLRITFILTRFKTLLL